MSNSTGRPTSGAAVAASRTASDAPFDSIESAQEFVHLLGEAIDEAIGETADMADAAGGGRHLDAMRLVTYKLRQLREHISASGKLLNDLRTLRRLLLNERGTRPDVDAPRT